MGDLVDDYGWDSTESTCTGSYVTPRILALLKNLRVNRICDLGSGNGAMAGFLRQEGYYVCGVENDVKGVELSRERYPDINFYCWNIQEKPQLVLAEEKQMFDAVVSTEVI